MRLYLDDDSVNALLVRLLERAGHDVECPKDVRLAGRSDAVHLEHSIASKRCLLSGNYDDFEELHNLIVRAGGKHPGILMVRRDDDHRDLKPGGIATAVGKLAAANVLLENQYVILNQWR